MPSTRMRSQLDQSISITQKADIELMQGDHMAEYTESEDTHQEDDVEDDVSSKLQDPRQE